MDRHDRLQNHGIRVRSVIFIFILSLVFTFSLFGQEDGEKGNTQSGQLESAEPVQTTPPVQGEFGEQPLPPTPTAAKKQKPKVKEGDQPKKKKGPELVAEHTKRKITRTFKEGEKIKFQTKTSKSVEKGTLEKVEKQFVTIDGKKIRISTLTMVGKKWSRTIGWRTVGFTNLGIGVGLTAAGVALIAFSADYVDANSTNVVWGTLGIVAGTGVGLVGLHLMVKGSKGVFESAKLKKDKGWSFKTQ